MMRYLIGALIALALVLLLGVAVAVALPCVTHHVYAVNETENAADFQIMLGDVIVWEGVVQPSVTRSVPVVTSIGDTSWTVKAITKTSPAPKVFVEKGDYVLGHPHERDIFVIVLTSEEVKILRIEHPFISAFKSKTWRTHAYIFLVAINVLSCLDCREVRWR
jgi:hypothetical protein